MESDDQFKQHLRRRLRTIRERSGKTREQISLASGVSEGTQKNWEDDRVTQFNPTIMALRAYSNACESSLGEVFEPWLADQQSSGEVKYVTRVIGRALKHPKHRTHVLSLVSLLQEIEELASSATTLA